MYAAFIGDARMNAYAIVRTYALIARHLVKSILRMTQVTTEKSTHDFQLIKKILLCRRMRYEDDIFCTLPRAKNAARFFLFRAILAIISRWTRCNRN